MPMKEAGMITVQVKPDLSRFKEATIEEIAKSIRPVVRNWAEANAIAEKFLEKFVILPR